MPKGMVNATWASSRLVARRTCGMRGGPTRAGDVARSLAEAPELALAQRPVYDDRFGGAALDRHGGVGDRRAGTAPAGQPRQAGVAQLGQPQVGGHERGVVAVLGERRQAVDVVGAHPGVGDRGQDRLHRQLVLAGAGDAAPFRVPGLAHPDEAGARRPPLTRGSATRRATSSVCSPSSGARRRITHGEPCARNGAPG